MISKGSLRWFGHIESKGDASWIEHCTAVEVEGLSEGTTKEEDRMG